LGCEIAGEPVLVTGPEDGELHAFSNVCRHRGALLERQAGTYSLDGRLYSAPEFDGVAEWDCGDV
jgi:choline monooxygenase